MAVTDPGRARTASRRSWCEKADPGFSFGAPERKLGIKGSPTRELYFDDCVIPADRIDRRARARASRPRCAPWTTPALTIGAQALGIAQGALDDALGYVKERRQFGQADRRVPGPAVHARRHGDEDRGGPRSSTYAAAAGRAERRRAADDLTFFGAAAKCFASDIAMAVTTDAVQLLGGYGYIKDFPVERMMRDAKITQIYEGTNQIQRMVMARQLLSTG